MYYTIPFIKILYIFLCFSVILSSCKKYPNEPSIKRAYLLGNHHLVKYALNGIDRTDSLEAATGENYKLYFDKSGNYKIEGNVPDEGKWSFSIDKKNLVLTSVATSNSEINYSIVKLKSQQLWIRRTLANGDVEEFHWFEYPRIA